MKFPVSKVMNDSEKTEGRISMSCMASHMTGSLDVRPYLLLFGDSLRYVSFFFSSDLFRFVWVRKRKNSTVKG